MANQKKSIIEEALLEAENIDATFKTNAKEILAHTMSSEIEEMVKESLIGSRKRLKEDEEENETLELDLDSPETEEETEIEDSEEVEGEEELDLDLGDNNEEEFEIELDDEETSELELDTDDLDLGSDEGVLDTELEIGDGVDIETIDLTSSSDSDIISVFKKMGPEDEIEVINDNGVVTLKDNKSGSEYRIELNHEGDVSDVETIELGEGEEDSDDVIYEIVVDDEDDMSYMEDSMSYMEDDMSYMDYKKSGLKHPNKADLDKDGDLTPYEMKRGSAIEKSMKRQSSDHMSDYMKDYMEDEMSDYMEDEMSDYMEDEMEEGRMPRTLGKASKLPNRKSYEVGDNRRKMYTSESKKPQITKLIKENTDLTGKVDLLETENKELKGDYKKMVETLRQFRTKLQEVAVFNSNLTYAVRLFTEHSTTNEEKQDILKRLDEAKDLKESQSIYKQLVKEFSNGKKPLVKESIEEKLNKTSSSGALINEQSVFVHPEIESMKKLWEYNYKK
jgi:hypothetical protein